MTQPSVTYGTVLSALMRALPPRAIVNEDSSVDAELDYHISEIARVCTQRLRSRDTLGG